MGGLPAPTDRMGVTIRLLRSTDRPCVEKILAACSVFSEEEIRVALEMVDAGLDGEYALLAIETDDQLDGYACFGPAPLTATSWYLYWICVRSQAQSVGVGRALQTAVEAAIRTQGGTCLVAETSGRADYAKTRRFYELGGFIEAGRIAGFYGPGDDCVILSKVLTGDTRE